MSNYTTDDNGIPLKRCSAGDNCLHPMGCWQPATLEYFHRHKKTKDGLRDICKACRIQKSKQYYEVNRNVMLEKQRIYRQDNVEYFREYDRNRRKDPDFVQRKAKYDYHYYRRTKPQKLAYDRKYNIANRERINKRNLEWIRKNPEKFLATQHRRMARKLSLPDTLTSEQWRACLEYHHYCCAVCGAQLRDLFGDIEPHADHWIPLASPDCPGTTAGNMLCLCSDCNLSKGKKLPTEWLVWKFGKRKAKEILARIQAYFVWVIQQE